MSRNTFLEPLALHLVYRSQGADGIPTTSDAGALAADLFSWLSFDSQHKTSSMLGIPTFIYAAASPPALDFSGAARNAIVVFSDDEMVNEAEWQDWTVGLSQQLHGNLLLHVALTRGHARLGLGGRQAILLADDVPPTRHLVARLRIARSLGRFLEPGGCKLFLSHAKRDDKGQLQVGHAMAVGLKDFIEKNRAERFFDEINLPDGELYESEFGRVIDESTVIVLLTDRYATRYWCQWEVLRAKRSHRPLILVDALETTETRHFPHVANAPLLRWPPDRNDDEMRYAVVNEALRETLRHAHARLLLRALATAQLLPSDILRYARPPELSTLDPESQSIVRTGVCTTEPLRIVHPDPPLSEPERCVIERVGRCRVFTIIQALAGLAEGPEKSLTGLRVAISISRGQAAVGFTDHHQTQLFVLLTRHLLAAGARVAYGGDLRAGGYTALLKDLIWAEVDSGEKLARDAVLNTIPWPETLNLSREQEAQLPIGFEVERGVLPAGTSVDPTAYVMPDTVEHRLAWTLALTAMRRRMTELTHARVLVGGPYQSAGYFPGLAEEALRHLQAGLPVYLIGAYGGVAQTLIEAVEGRRPHVFTREAQLSLDAAERDVGQNDLRAATYDAYRERFSHEALTYEEMAETFAIGGVAGLNNGLSEEDNRQLFVTRSPLEQAALVLRGLRASRARLLARV